MLVGGTVAKFSGQNVHKRLVSEPSYAEHQWEDALKRAFLGTDDDIRAGEFWSVIIHHLPWAHFLSLMPESRFFRDPSGCTAVAALITQDQRIFVVRI